MGRSFFWDGANPSLETQALFPLEAHIEMANTAEEAVNRLKDNTFYQDLFFKAFGTEPTISGMLFAIASYERTLISANSPYDQYLQGDLNALSQSALRGMDIFFGETAECFHCHGGFNFTDELFHNNGLYESYSDNGRWEVTGREADRAKFKTPTLRNIEHTAPYMHDGSLKTLEEVVDHYQSGGEIHPNKSVLIREFPGVFTDQDKTRPYQLSEIPDR